MVKEYRKNVAITADGVTEIHGTDEKLYTEHYTWEEWKNLLLKCHSPQCIQVAVFLTASMGASTRTAVSFVFGRCV